MENKTIRCKFVRYKVVLPSLQKSLTSLNALTYSRRSLFGIKQIIEKFIACRNECISLSSLFHNNNNNNNNRLIDLNNKRHSCFHEYGKPLFDVNTCHNIHCFSNSINNNSNNNIYNNNSCNNNGAIKSCRLDTLCCATRKFTSFEGSCEEFAEEIKEYGDAVIVFFYRPICAPCAAIRSKIIDVADSLSGGTLKRKNHTSETSKNDKNHSSFVTHIDSNKNDNTNINVNSSTNKEYQKQHEHNELNSTCTKYIKRSSEMPPEEVKHLVVEENINAIQCEREENNINNWSKGNTCNNNENNVNNVNDINNNNSSSSNNNKKTVSEGNASHMVMSNEDLATCHKIQKNVSKEFAKALQNVKFLTVDTTRHELLTALHDVRSLPTFIAYRNGRIIGRVEGAHDSELTSLLQIVKSNNAEQHKAENQKS